MSASDQPPTPASTAPILCLDFDGVIHDYKKGWMGGEIYGELTPGFVTWATDAMTHFRLVIYSSRSKTPEGVAAMKTWLRAKFEAWHDAHVSGWGHVLTVDDFDFAHEKPPAFLTIDDRAIRFEGTWNAPDMWPRQLRKFQPWMAAHGPKAGGT